MPLPVDPTQTFDVVLGSDAGKPEADQVRFRFRYMSAREFMRTSDLADKTPKELEEDYGAKGVVEKLFETIKINLEDVLMTPTVNGDIEDLLTVGEAWELFYNARRQSRLGVAEKNASGSPSPLPGDASAEDASQAESAATP